jgi:hypothetical protein
MNVVSRAEWGARPWNPRKEMWRVDPSDRTEWFAHYHGNPPRHDRGVAMAREVESIHLANGWAGVGYGHMVGQDGVAYEGRGWALVGAHCPGHNRSGFSVYFAVGGSTRPTAAALTTARLLYQEACTRAARNLRKTWHGQNWPTECPGPHLRGWVQAGLPAPPAPPPMGDDDMPTADEIAEAVWGARFGDSGRRESAADRLAAAAAGVRSLVTRPVVDVDALAAAVVQALPVGVGAPSAAEIADELAKRLEA